MPTAQGRSRLVIVLFVLLSAAALTSVFLFTLRGRAPSGVPPGPADVTDGQKKPNGTTGDSGSDKRSIAALVKILENEKKTDEARVAAAWELVAAGERARDAVPALAELMVTDNSIVGVAAWSALKHLGPHAEPALPWLIRMLGGDRGRQWMAGEVLRRMGSAGRPAVPALLAALRTSDGRNRETLIEALGETAGGHQGALEALRQIITADRSDVLRDVAAEAVKRIEERR